MKSTVKKAAAMILLMTVILSLALPAFAANPWYTYQGSGYRTRTLSVRLTRNRNASRWLNTTLLTQTAGTVVMRNRYSGWEKLISANGTYYVTIVQTRDAYGRRVNKRVCTNRFWTGQRFNVALSAGEYRVSVRSVGCSYNATRALANYYAHRWYTYPRYRVG